MQDIVIGIYKKIKRSFVLYFIQRAAEKRLNLLGLIAHKKVVFDIYRSKSVISLCVISLYFVELHVSNFNFFLCLAVFQWIALPVWTECAVYNSWNSLFTVPLWTCSVGIRNAGMMEIYSLQSSCEYT